ncbi:MAG TPA: C39 family peptidase [Anaerolineae bacterium]
MSPLKSPTHITQTGLGYCLPACAQMALAQLGIDETQQALAETLGTRTGIGTPFSRIERLAAWSVEVRVTEWGGVDALETALAGEAAVIAAVVTSPKLPGWPNLRTQHTVLIVGIDAEQVTYHDPALTYGPVSTSRGEYLLAWSEMSELVAFLTRLQ